MQTMLQMEMSEDKVKKGVIKGTFDFCIFSATLIHEHENNFAPISYAMYMHGRYCQQFRSLRQFTSLTVSKPN